MAGWHHEGAFKEKECAVCETPFIPKSGVHKFCSETCKGRWKYIVGVETTESQYARISGNWRRYFVRLCNRSTGRSGLSAEDCLELLEQQEGLCALSGIELTCKLEKGVVCKTNASLDRIEAGGPYIKSNVQLVCAVLNKFRIDTPLDEFKWWCRKVTEYTNG